MCLLKIPTVFCMFSLVLFFLNNIENIPEGVALYLKRTCNSNKKFGKHSAEYQNLITRNYKLGKVKKKQFSDILVFFSIQFDEPFLA